MQQPIAYGVGQGRVADIRMPVPNRALAGDHSGARLVEDRIAGPGGEVAKGAGNV